MELKVGSVEVKKDTNILDIEVPKQMEINLPTGMKVINRLFAGDGITPSTAAMVTGMPGAGKSTLLMQLADSLTAQGYIAIYNTGEESLHQVRRVVNRLKLTNGFIVGQERNVDKIIDHATTLQLENPDKKVFLIQDSLQCLETTRDAHTKGRPMSGARAQLTSLSRLIEWAKTTYGVLFVIGQVNKKGDFAGKNEIKHMIDCHMHLGYELLPNNEEVPCVEMTKNRFGISGLYYHFDLYEDGISFKENRK